ncbi:hypothetical protein [Paenibacillus sp. NPDC057967]|uniref:hypothetical protein n=1 Tax=Paenibacillus sp. NPDC057967 TaxID=3346293 RepID=UPI0036D926DD
MVHGLRKWGSTHLPVEETVTAGVNDYMSFIVDGITYSIVLDAGVYRSNRDHFTSDFPAHINKKLSEVNAPIFCRLGGNHQGTPVKNVLVFEHKNTGEHYDISNISGSAIDLLFGQIEITEESSQ